MLHAPTSPQYPAHKQTQRIRPTDSDRRTTGLVWRSCWRKREQRPGKESLWWSEEARGKDQGLWEVLDLRTSSNFVSHNLRYVPLIIFSETHCNRRYVEQKMLLMFKLSSIRINKIWLNCAPGPYVSIYYLHLAHGNRSPTLCISSHALSSIACIPSNFFGSVHLDEEKNGEELRCLEIPGLCIPSNFHLDLVHSAQKMVHLDKELKVGQV